MKQIVITIVLSITTAAAIWAGCGLKPLKPLTPIGCKDLRAICLCDSTGTRCSWKWECVK